MRKRIYNFMETSRVYNSAMVVFIIASLVPLAVKTSPPWALLLDRITVAVFILDYLLRLFTADENLHKGASSFVRYPFTPMATLDLLSILPSLILLNPSLKLARLARIIRAARVLRVGRITRYSKSAAILSGAIRRSSSSLLLVGSLAIGYIFAVALVMFNCEPESFRSFFDAVYWSTVSLTTVGYGDLYPVTDLGRVVAMVSSFVGIAVVALPAGLLAAAYVEEIESRQEKSGR